MSYDRGVENTIHEDTNLKSQEDSQKDGKAIITAIIRKGLLVFLFPWVQPWAAEAGIVVITDNAMPNITAFFVLNSFLGACHCREMIIKLQRMEILTQKGRKKIFVRKSKASNITLAKEEKMRDGVLANIYYYYSE